MKPIIKITLLPVFIFFLFSCKKSTYVNSSGGNGVVNMKFSNNVGSNSLYFGEDYTNQHGDHFTVSMFKYYVSNVKLEGDGVSYTEPNSYHLIDHNNPSGSSFQMTNMPYGTFTKITFTVGVDSLQDVLGPGTGVLDVSYNMFLTPAAGYVMLKLEGNSPQSTRVGNAITFHATGFWGANTALRTVTVAFDHPISVTGNLTSIGTINVYADVLAIFKSPNVFDFSITDSIMAPGADVTKLADNYAHMFSAKTSM